MQRKYYVYQHKTETDGRVFYIGCGDEKRPYNTYKSNRSKEWKDIYQHEGLIVEILLETTDEDEALELESKYIKQYGRICDGGTLVNKSLYKNTSGVNHSEETKQKISKTLKGQIPPNRKPVLQYTKNGEFIKEWSSLTIAAKELNLNIGKISNVCNGKRNHTGGFIWKYKSIDDKI